MEMANLVFSGNVVEIERLLSSDPELALIEIPLPGNLALASPLHRICDGVFNQRYSETTGIELAKIFLKYGAAVNISSEIVKDSPLTAACSLQCDQLALLYIDHGARIDHRGCHGGTALHWSAWCGRDVVLEKIVSMNPEINQLCIDFKSTPFFWALHGYKFGGQGNRHHQIQCAKILLEHGADISIPNFEGYLPIQVAEKDDHDILALFEK